MLSKERIEELHAIVKKAHPNYGTKEMKEPVRNTRGYGGYDYALPAKTSKGFLPAFQPPQLTAIANCCGATQIQNVMGEMKGLHSLSTMTEVERAIFALWLNDNAAPKYTAIFCMSASPNKAKFDPGTEKCLEEAGFVPLLRGYNLCHGPNHVTMWALQFNESSLPKPDPTPPAKPAKKRLPAAVDLFSTARRARKRATKKAP